MNHHHDDGSKMQEVDVIVCTRNSEATLEECLQSIKENIPYHRLIVVDGMSSDETCRIAKRFGAEIHSEALGLSYARELGIALTDCPFLAYVDSDVVITENWYAAVMSELQEPTVGSAQGFLVPLDRERRQFFEFWHKIIKGKKEGFQTHNTIIRTEAVKDWHPGILTNYYEFTLLANHIRSKGYRIVEVKHQTWHLSQWSNHHAFNAGKAYTRIFGFKIHKLLWRLLTPIKTIPPAVFYRNPKVLTRYTQYWLAYARGMISEYCSTKSA